MKHWRRDHARVKPLVLRRLTKVLIVFLKTFVIRVTKALPFGNLRSRMNWM